jgi:hypothetical protein
MTDSPAVRLRERRARSQLAQLLPIGPVEALENVLHRFRSEVSEDELTGNLLLLLPNSFCGISKDFRFRRRVGPLRSDDRRRAGGARPRAALLHHVRQLVRQQALSGRGVRCVLCGPEADVTPQGESPRLDCRRRRGRLRPGVHPHAAEVAKSELTSPAPLAPSALRCTRVSSSSQLGHVAPPAEQAAHVRCMTGSGIRITVSAMRFASRS